MSRFSRIMKTVLVSLALILMGASCMDLGGVGKVLHGERRLNPALRPSVLDLYYPCSQEDGSGYDQEYPCVWDAAVQGNGLYAGARYLIYGDFTECPMPDPAIRCEVLD